MTRLPLTVTKAEAVYREVRRMILDGTQAPGSSINQEVLAAQLGVSITPLREALRRLEAERFLSASSNRLYVRELSREEAAEIYAVRLQLDPLAAELAAGNMNDEQIDELESLAHDAPDGLHERLHANRAFHRAIYFGSANTTLAQTLDLLWDQTDRYRLLVLRNPAITDASQQEHIQIAAAIRDRDGQKARELMAKHVRSVTEHLGVQELLGGAARTVS